MSNKPNKTVQLHWTLFTLGVVLIIVAIAVEINNPQNKLSLIVTTIGGTIFGSSLSWLFEEYYKEDDGRFTSNELWSRSLNIIEDALKRDDLPKEDEIKIFRKTALHFYNLTQSEEGRLFWHYTTIDFSSKVQKHLGRLTTKVSFYNFRKTKTYFYNAELIRRYSRDYLILMIRRVDGQEPISISIFDPSTGTKNTYGFMLLDDWSDNSRLSPSIISFDPLFDIEVGAVSHDIALELQNLWNVNFKNISYRKIFEEYS